MTEQRNNRVIILRRKQVEQCTGLSRSTIYLRIAQEDFPKTILLGARAVGWLDSEMEEWLNSRVELSKGLGVGTYRERSPETVQSPNLTGGSCHLTLGQIRHVADLVPHPHLVKHTKGYTTQELSTLSGRGEAAFTDPTTITHENVLVEGYAIWQLAILKRRGSLTCTVRHMRQEDALLYLLDRYRGSKGIGDFPRILMALELEFWFRERAKSNQRVGGRDKGSTQLTEAGRLDMRIEVARAAGVSAGNVSKVKQIQQAAIPPIREALLTGEIQINRAAIWSRSAQSIQECQLSNYRNEHGIRRTITVLLRKHQDRYPMLREGLRDVQRGLRSLHTDPHLSSVFPSLHAVIEETDEVLNPDEVSRAA